MCRIGKSLVVGYVTYLVMCSIEKQFPIERLCENVAKLNEWRGNEIKAMLRTGKTLCFVCCLYGKVLECEEILNGSACGSNGIQDEWLAVLRE